MTDIRRYKDRSEYTVGEELRAQQAERRGEPAPQIETAEYREARAEALADAGLADEPDREATDDDKDIEDLSVGEHVERLQRERS